MVYGISPRRWIVAAALLTALLQAPAHAEVRVTGLTDVAFGTLDAPIDQANSQNVSVCSYANWYTTLGYSVRATGSGSGGAFTLTTGAATLAYDVQWADSANQTSGTLLRAGVASGGFGNAAGLFACLFQVDSASLTVTIRAAQLASAAAGTYTGTLQIMIVPE